MTLENTILTKIEKFKENIIRIIPTPNNDVPLSDVSGGDSGTSSNYAKADHRHPTPEGLIDSTWTALTVNSNFYNYTENNDTLLPLQYRKIGNVIEIIGIVGINADLTVGQWTIGTLPTGCRPSKEISFLCGLYNNNNIWTCIIKTNGDITFNNLRDISSSVTLNVTYTDDSTGTLDLAKATTTIAGTKWVDALKINGMFII